MKSLKEKCTILMLAYNGIADALDAARSLQPQWEHIDQFILGDNGSNQENKSLLSQHAEGLNITALDQPDNLGFAGGFNRLFQEGLKRSQAEYFLILNNDTEAAPDFLKQLLDIAEPNKVVSPMILWFRDKETVIQCAGDFDRVMMKMKNHFAGLKASEVPKGIHEVEQTDGCCFMIHRSWLEKGFQFDDKLFIYFEDVELFHRLRQCGVTFHYNTDSVLYHKEYGSSGGRDKPSPFRNYYFNRNRFYLTRIMHPLPKRWRVYWRIWRLAMENYKTQKSEHPQAAKAIKDGIKDFFTGKMGKSYIP
jgi:GT2 family glycosyltransferase